MADNEHKWVYGDSASVPKQCEDCGCWSNSDAAKEKCIAKEDL